VPHIFQATSRPALGAEATEGTPLRPSARPSAKAAVDGDRPVPVRMDRRAHDAARGHAVVATLGQRALAGTDFPLLLDQTVSLVADAMKVAAVAVCEVAEDGRLLVRASHGLNAAVSRLTCLSGDRHRFPASALDCETPIADPTNGPPLARDPFLAQEGLVHTVAMRIPGRSRPFGLLIAGARHERNYSHEDLFFIHAVANVLGAAFERAAMDRAEEEHRALERQMLHVQKLESLGVLAGGIAHDFNNLLVSVLGNAGLALAELPPVSPVRSRLTDIELAAQRAAELTRQMLAYAGRGRVVVQRVNLSDLVVELVTLLRTVVARTADIDVRLTDNLPDVEADASQLRQVVMNLVTNAADAIGGVPGRIEITTGRMSATREYLSHCCIGEDLEPGEFVFAEIADTGCGMDDKTKARIFDPFFTTKVTGRGLGLAAVLGIVRSHRGAIAVESTPGVGTRFRLLLPTVGIASSNEPVPQGAQKTAAPIGTILIVDDDDGVRTVSTLSLERAGFRVVSARDGEEGMALMEQRGDDFDAVLLDMTMPRLSGAETCHLIRQMRPELPIVLTSGYTEPETDARLDIRGVAGFLQKPFSPASLVMMIQDAVMSRRQERR
jgi:signal transduction histidine kinase/ActR/RegA family two-component response regulator